MATMIPAVWEDVNHSRAEATVYRKLRDETPDSWYAAHSVGLTSHAHKTWAEIDFVIVGSFGVLCIEVKGGRITTERGQWFTGGHELRESPFQQAGGGAAALRRELRELFPSARRALVEYAVAFPDVAFTGRGPGIDEAIVYDDDDLATPFEQYVDRVIAYWRQRRELGNDQFRPLSHSERSAITAWLAPSFDLIPSLRSRVAQAEAELVELTKVQGRVLRSVRTMDRALIRGGAGTGKTFLAVDEAVRFAVEGRKVLFCCRSPLLARYLRPAMPEDLIDIWDFQSLARDLVDRSGRTSRLPDADDDDLLAVFVPEQAAEGALELGVACSYDVLVLDEAQDLMNEGALDLFDILLDGGMDHGKWRVFLDHKQNVFAALDVEQFKRLAGAAVSQLELVDNCRNTPQIATTTCMLAALDLDETLASEGPDVDVRFAVDANDEATIVGQLLRAWTQSGVEASDIVVLGDESTPPRRVAQRLPAGLPALRAYEEREAGQPSWCSIEDFKGLEAAGVIVIGVRDLSTRKMRRRVYVGCSRARTLLAVVLDVGARDDFNLRAAEFARTVTDRSARSAGPAS